MQYLNSTPLLKISEATCLTFCIVNGVEMVIDVEEVWKEVVDLDMDGVRKFKETIDVYQDSNL